MLISRHATELGNLAKHLPVKETDLLIIIIVRKQIRKKLINRRKFININSETKYNFSKNNKIFIDGNLT